MPADFVRIKKKKLHIENKSFLISGTFIINQNINFIDCDIRMQPGASIIVTNNSTLFLKNTYVWGACGEMWEEILVDGGGNHIETDNSLIEDGKAAIHCDKGGAYELKNTVFNKNFRSVYLTDAGLGTVTSCLFTCQDLPSAMTNFHNNYYGAYTTVGFPTTSLNTTLLKSPYQTIRSYCGIVAINTRDVIVGDAANADNLNIFDYLDFGIRATDLNLLKAYNNLFWRIEYFDTPPVKNPPNAAIWTNSQIDGFSLFVGDYNTNELNRFYDCQNGIWSKGIYDKYLVFNNRFENTIGYTNDRFGISHSGHTNFFIVEGNKMLNMNYGICKSDFRTMKTISKIIT